MIKFHCPHCGQKIGVPDEHSGKKIKCPNCTAVVPIPKVQPVPGQLTAADRLQAVRRPAGPVAAAGETAEQGPALPVPARQLDQCLNGLRGRPGEWVFEMVARLAYFAAAYGMLALGALLVAGAVAGGLSDRLEYSPTKDYLILAGLLIIAQYLLCKVHRAGVSLVGSSPSAIASGGLLDCLALAALAAAVGAVVVGAYLAVASSYSLGTIFPVVMGLAASVGCFAVACALLNPSTLNVSVRAGLSAGGEAIGLLSFFLKLALVAGPILLSFLVLAAVLAAGTELTLILLKRSTLEFFWWTHTASIAAIAFSGVYVIVYLAFLVYHLLVDLAQAIFQIARNTQRK